MRFGSSDGSRLSALSHITACFDSTVGFVRGFAFFYTDGSHDSYGETQPVVVFHHFSLCLEQTIAIGGPHGERIVNVEYTAGAHNCAVPAVDLSPGLRYRVQDVRVSPISSAYRYIQSASLPISGFALFTRG